MTTIKEASLKIPALHCGSCASTVKRYAEALSSVEVTEADPDSKVMTLRYDESAVSLEEIREALDEVGFSAEE